MKKIVCMLLCAVMTVFFFGCGEPKWAESPVEDFEYEENEDGGITITRYIGEETEVVIPEKINEKNGTVIGKDAFSFILHLTFVKIPDTVTEIEDLAFDHKEALTEVFLSKNLKSIGYCAFEDCTALSKISLPSSLETMGDGAFIGCTALKTAVVGKNLKNWGTRVFAYTGLENLTLEEGLESIGHAAFLGTGLRKVTLSKGLKRVSVSAFYGCKNLKTVSMEDGLLEIGDPAFGRTALREVVLPASVEAVKNIAFFGCNSHEKVKLKGDAPSVFKTDEKLTQIDGGDYAETEDFYGNFTVCYREGAKGFTSPTWNGYATEIW